MDSLKKRELQLYTVAWALVFIIVPLVFIIRHLSSPGGDFSWDQILDTWLGILPFLVLFIAHNRLAVPFIQKSSYLGYFLISFTILAAFSIWCFVTNGHPDGMDGMPPPPPFGESDRMAPPQGRHPLDPNVMKVIMGFLVMAANLGVKAVFNTLKNEQKMQELKAETLSRRLETLRYQINPHFFMNTLNNIHALVDMDPEKAKESIEEFSKLMRIVLYDGDAPTIPLQKELDFIQHYISLMKLRYPESVRIELSLPGQVEGAEVPPLVMASFVENAFKHGISYEKTSFVRVSVSLENKQIFFKCTNSRHEQAESGQHGLGLDNLRSRLNLIYGDSYTLHMEEGEDVYEVLLVLPEREASV